MRFWPCVPAAVYPPAVDAPRSMPSSSTYERMIDGVLRTEQLRVFEQHSGPLWHKPRRRSTGPDRRVSPSTRRPASRSARSFRGPWPVLRVWRPRAGRGGRGASAGAAGGCALRRRRLGKNDADENSGGCKGSGGLRDSLHKITSSLGFARWGIWTRIISIFRAFFFDVVDHQNRHRRYRISEFQAGDKALPLKSVVCLRGKSRFPKLLKKLKMDRNQTKPWSGS